MMVLKNKWDIVSDTNNAFFPMTACVNLIYLQILCIYSSIHCKRDHTDSDIWIKKTQMRQKKQYNISH